MARSVANANGYGPLALGLGVIGGLIGAGVGWYVGEAFGAGFRLDWYRYRPPVNTPVGEVEAIVFLVGAALALVLFPIVYSLAHREWARRIKQAAEPPIRSRAPSRSTYGFQLAAGLALAIPSAAALVVYAFLSLQGLGTSVASEDLVPLCVLGLALVGFTVVFLTVTATGKRLAQGRLRTRADEDNVFAKIALFCGRHANVTIVTLLLATVALGAGLTRLDTNVDVADVLPRGDPNTDAAHNLTSKFKSSFTLQVTFQLHTAASDVYERDNRTFLSQRRTAGNYRNISDEVYVRAIDQLLQFVLTYRDGEEKSPFVGSVALSDFYRIINWTIAGGRQAQDSEGSYSLPSNKGDGPDRYRLVDQGVWSVIPATADAVISPDFQQTAALVIVDPKETMGSKEIGLWALRLRQAYMEWASDNDQAYQVFTGENSPKFSVDLPLANAHSSQLAARDFRVLLPILAVWIMVTVFLAFRNWASIGIALAALALGVVWTFGLMGYMGIPLNTLNLTVIPLIMGVGIDYGIHTINEYQAGRSEGLTNQEVFRRLGARGFLALFVATLNTIVGLAVMIVSPSLLIGQLGILACIAIAASFFITITFIPAALSAVPAAKAREYRPSPLMATLARAVSGQRVLVLLAIAALTTYALVSAPLRLRIEEFGDPPRNWLKSDPLRQEHEIAIEGFYSSPTDDVKANILIFEGDINDPAAHQYMDRLEATLKTYGGKGVPTKPGTVAECEDRDGTYYGRDGRIIADTLRTLPFLMRTYLAVRDGAGGAASYTALTNLATRSPNLQSQDPYPRDRETLTSLMDEIHTTPLRGLANFFYDYPADRMAMMLFSVRAATYEDAQEVWCQVQSALLANEAFRPRGMQVSFFGNTAINYLFVAKELPWVGYMSIVDNLLVMAFVYIPTRQWRPTLVVGAINLLTGIWWLSLLPDLGVGLAITLTLPLVFIYAIGSDYGLHLVLGAMATKDTEETFRTTGKAILFSGITTFGAFLIYTQMSNLAVRRTMIATAAAIPVIFLVTLLVVPLLYPVRRRRADAAPALEAPQPPPALQAPPAPSPHVPPAPATEPFVATKKPKAATKRRRRPPE